MCKDKFFIGLICVVGLWSTVPSAQAETVNVEPGDGLEQTVAGLEPGDTLVVADGTYTLDERFGVDVLGTETDPIVIRAADGAEPVVNRPAANQNIWDINATYLTIRGLTFTGGAAGLRFESASHVTVQDCEVSGTDGVAIRTNDDGQTYDHVQILANELHDTGQTGEGMYLGCNHNACQIHDSLFANNHIYNTNGSSVTQGDGIEIKEGSYNNVIRDNVIHDTGYPCLLTYSTVGNGAVNIIEGNVMWNCGDNAIQSAADTTIRNNIILGAVGAGIAMQPHQDGTPGNLRVVHNTIVNDGDAIALRGATGTVVIANNAVYSQSGSAVFERGDLGQVTVAGNVGVGGVDGGSGGVTTGNIGTDFVDAMFGGGPMNVFPSAGGALPEAGATEYVTDIDFNGLPRQGTADVGAYRFDESGNPGWTIVADFKELAEDGPDDPGQGDAGMADTGMADAGMSDVGMEDTGQSDTASPEDASTTDTTGPDGGSPDGSNLADTGDGDAADSQADAASLPQPDDNDSDGCGCSTAANPVKTPGSLALAGLFLVLGAWLKRRRW